MAELEQLQQIITSLVVEKRSSQHTETRRGDEVIRYLHLDTKIQLPLLIQKASYDVLSCLNDSGNKKIIKQRLGRKLKSINITLRGKNPSSVAVLNTENVDTIIRTAEIMLAQQDDVTLENVLKNINENIKFVENANLFIVKVALSLFGKQHSWKQHINLKITSYIADKEVRKKAVTIVLDYFNKILKVPTPTEHEANKYRETAFKNLQPLENSIRIRNKILDMFAQSEEDKIPDDISSIQDDAMSIHSYESDNDEDIDLALAEAKALELTRLIWEVKDLSDTSMLEYQDLINIIPERLIKLSNNIPHAIQRKFS